MPGSAILVETTILVDFLRRSVESTKGEIAIYAT